MRRRRFTLQDWGLTFLGLFVAVLFWFWLGPKPEGEKTFMAGSYADVKEAIRNGDVPHTTDSGPQRPKKALADVFANMESDDFTIDLWEHAWYRLETLGADKLSEAELTFLSVNDVSGEVPNGGFDQYFFNSSGDLALHVVPALKRIGANATADIAKRAIAVFENSSPSPDRRTRWEQINRIPEARKDAWNRLDDEFYKDQDDLYKLLNDYVKAHQSEFTDAHKAR